MHTRTPPPPGSDTAWLLASLSRKTSQLAKQPLISSCLLRLWRAGQTVACVVCLLLSCTAAARERGWLAGFRGLPFRAWQSS